jgi:Fe-S cluster assembly protein SufD
MKHLSVLDKHKQLRLQHSQDLFTFIMQDLQEKLITGFQGIEGSVNGLAQTSIHATRRQAMTRFAELGFPTIRHEEWKYTSLVPALKHEYRLPAQSSSETASRLTSSDIAPFLMPELDAQTLVFVNGVYAPELSMIHVQKGVTVLPLADALHDKHPVVEKHFAHVADWNNDALIALNTAYSLNGAFIEVQRGTVVERPFHLVFVNDARVSSVFAPLRNLFVMGENAEATVLETAHTLASGENHSFTSSVSEGVLAENARLHHYKIQNDVEASYYVGATSVRQEATSLFNSVVITLSGGIVRNNLSTVLGGKAADAHYYGLYCVDGKTLVDNHTFVDHAVAHCTSNELYKGIMDARSTGVFNGKIMVREDAQKTLAYQSNRNILLSNNATINTKPQLEIFADDVKCSHGCTTGQLDEESLFYLRARGLDKEQARALLLTAFAGEVLDKISLESLKNRLESVIAERLEKEIL